MKRMLLAMGVENVPTPSSTNECDTEIDAMQVQIEHLQVQIGLLQLGQGALEARKEELTRPQDTQDKPGKTTTNEHARTSTQTNPDLVMHAGRPSGTSRGARSGVPAQL